MFSIHKFVKIKEVPLYPINIRQIISTYALCSMYCAMGRYWVEYGSRMIIDNFKFTVQLTIIDNNKLTVVDNSKMNI